MNRVLTFAFTLLLGLVIMACQGEKSTETNVATPPPVAPMTAPPSAPAAAGVAGVEHYICPSGHVGSGGAAQGTCAECGVALVHNQAFHANAPAATGAPAQNPMLQNPGAAGAPTVAAPPTEPAQNAAGVWHYTCSAGCAGGGAAAGPCSQCGGALAHNQAYHN